MKWKWWKLKRGELLLLIKHATFYVKELCIKIDVIYGYFAYCLKEIIKIVKIQITFFNKIP